MSLHLIRTLTVVLALVIPTVTYAQAAPTIGVGVAIPGGALGEQRNPGPVVRIGVTFGPPTKAAQFRLEGEVAHMRGNGSANSWSNSHFTSIAALANLIVGPRGLAAPYVLLGAGIQRLQATGVQNPYGVTGGLRLGLGVRGHVRQTHGYVEIVSHLNLTDFAAGDFEAGFFFPVVVGVRF
jgi:hypothetical protein